MENCLLFSLHIFLFTISLAASEICPVAGEVDKFQLLRRQDKISPTASEMTKWKTGFKLIVRARIFAVVFISFRAERSRKVIILDKGKIDHARKSTRWKSGLKQEDEKECD